MKNLAYIDMQHKIRCNVFSYMYDMFASFISYYFTYLVSIWNSITWDEISFLLKMPTMIEHPQWVLLPGVACKHSQIDLTQKQNFSLLLKLKPSVNTLQVCLVWRLDNPKHGFNILCGNLWVITKKLIFFLFLFTFLCNALIYPIYISINGSNFSSLNVNSWSVQGVE